MGQICRIFSFSRLLIQFASLFLASSECENISGISICRDLINAPGLQKIWWIEHVNESIYH